MAWMNPDGLYTKFGTERAVTTKAGEYVTTAALREIEVKIDLTALTESEVIQSDVTFFPKMRIEEVEVITHTAGVTGAGIDVGLIRTDRTTELDYNGFIAALATTAFDAAGEKTVLRVGSTGAGALIGTTLSNVGYITASRTTATAFTAGVIYVKIRYYAA